MLNQDSAVSPIGPLPTREPRADWTLSPQPHNPPSDEIGPFPAGEVLPAPLHVAELELSGEPADGEPLDDIIQMWLREAGRTPLLGIHDEAMLARRIEIGMRAVAALRDRSREMAPERRAALAALVTRAQHAREHLTCANLRLVVAVAKRYMGRGLTFGDLVQEGNIGLLRAVEKFDYRRGYKFSTYATWWVRQSISRAIADQGRTIRVPAHMVESMNRVMRSQNSLHQSLGREATLEEVAEDIGLSVERVREIARIIPEPMSLETPLGDGEEAHLADFVIDTGTTSPSEAFSQLVRRDQLSDLMRDVLSEREHEVLALRYGLTDGTARTLEEVGVEVGVTRERIRQIEARAMKKLRHPSRTSRLKEIIA